MLKYDSGEAGVILSKHSICTKTNVILQTFKLILYFFFSSRHFSYLAIVGPVFMDMRQIGGSTNCRLFSQPPTDCYRIFLYKVALSNLFHIHCETRMMSHYWHSWDLHHGWMYPVLHLVSHVENDSSVVVGYLNMLRIRSDSKHECVIGKYYTYFKDEEPG